METTNAPPPSVVTDELSEAERAYRRMAPTLWPWAGWHAVLVGTRLVGVFDDPEAAVRAALSARGDALIRRIGPASAVAVRSADGGLPAGRARAA